jgi:hypothetical protein
MMESKVDHVARFQAAFASGDRELLAQLVHPDFENPQSSALPYGGQSYRGLQGFYQFALGIFPSTWKIERFDTLHRFYEKGTEPGIESVVLLFHLVGTVAATGEAVDTTLLEHWIFKDGRLLYSKPHWFEPPRNAAAPPK